MSKDNQHKIDLHYHDEPKDVVFHSGLDHLTQL
jgi:hypothetical protein